MPTNAVFTPVDANGNALATTAPSGGAATLVTSPAATVTTFLTYVSVPQAASNTGASFTTTAVSALAVDITLASFAGGTSPTVTFFVDRFGADGVWYRLWTSTALSGAGPTSANIGAGQSGTGAAPGVLTNLARFGWTSTGAPTSITFSASVMGR